MHPFSLPISRGSQQPGDPRHRPEKALSVGAVPSDLMPAAVYVGDGRIEVEEVPGRSPGPGEVLVEIAECGICGSDLHMVLERYAKPGAILGHEWSGIVAAAPERLRLGARRPRRGKPGPGVRRVPALPAGPAFGVPAAAPRRTSSGTGARSASTRRSGPTA